MLSCVLILPDGLRDEGNRMGAAMGWGPENFSVPLSADGSEPATHWGGRGEVTDEFIAMIADAAVARRCRSTGAFTASSSASGRISMLNKLRQPKYGLTEKQEPTDDSTYYSSTFTDW